MAHTNGVSGEGCAGPGLSTSQTKGSGLHFQSVIPWPGYGAANGRFLDGEGEMRFRSTGLGDVELKGTISNLSSAGDDLLVLEIKTYEPVKWHLRAGIERKDIPGIVQVDVKALGAFACNANPLQDVRFKMLTMVEKKRRPLGKTFISCFALRNFDDCYAETRLHSRKLGALRLNSHFSLDFCKMYLLKNPQGHKNDENRERTRL